MDHNDRYIVELSRAAIFDDTPFRPEKDVNWEYIYEKSIEQKIAGLVFAAASKLTGENKPPDDILAKFNDEMFATIALTSGQNIEFARTVKAALEKNIRLIGLKGCIIRSIYPVPELRTMSDYDILTSPENLKDVRAFFENIGYGYGKDAFGCVFEKDLFYWEVFTTMGEEFRINTEKWDKYFFENTVEENGIYTVSPTAFLLHLIVHTGKHYVSTGAGIRNLMDIALYTAKYKDKIDFDLIKAACEEQNYKGIFEYTMTALQLFYGVENDYAVSDKDKAETFVEYSLESGVFGKHDNALAIQAAKPEDDSISGIRKILFPSVKSLSYRYKYLQKAPFLLPVAWVQRVFSAIFKHKFSVGEMVMGMKDADEFSKHRLEKLKELELDDVH